MSDMSLVSLNVKINFCFVEVPPAHLLSPNHPRHTYMYKEYTEINLSIDQGNYFFLVLWS